MFVAAVVGATLSLATSWLLVSRIERLSERFCSSDALLGLIAALAADAPEVTSAFSAVSQHERSIGVGVVLGSNVFNIAALLGLGALVAGRIRLHRRVILLSGVVAVLIAALAVVVVEGLIAGGVGLGLAAAVLVPYVVVLGEPRALREATVFTRQARWLALAVREEEEEIAEVRRPPVGTTRDAVVAAVALVVVVGASVMMERATSSIGRHYHLRGIVVGGLLLAAVTSLPNVVAAVHLAHRGRGAAVLSTTLNSNTLNVVVGLFATAAILGLVGGSGTLVAIWYAALTLAALVIAYVGQGLRRPAGWLIIGAYAAFVLVLVLA